MPRKKSESPKQVVVYAYAEDRRLLLYSQFNYEPKLNKEVVELLDTMRDGLQKTWDTVVHFEFYDRTTGKSVSLDILNQFTKEVIA
jgi:hypothetical protein